MAFLISELCVVNSRRHERVFVQGNKNAAKLQSTVTAMAIKCELNFSEVKLMKYLTY